MIKSALVVTLIGFAGLAVAQQEAASPPPSPQAAILYDVRIGELVYQLRVPEARKEARTQLAKLGTDATQQLVEHLEDDDAHVRWEIVSLLGTIADERAATQVAARAVNDDNAHVRWRALWALSRFERSRDTILASLRASLAEKDERVAWNAAVALSFFGASDGVDALNAGVRSPDGWKRWEAINALGRVHDAKSVKALAPALESPSPRDRGEAALSLGHIGGADARALLVKTLDDPIDDVRWRACLALSAAGDEAVVPRLEELSKSDPSEKVRAQAQKTLAKLARRTTSGS
ncbi:MAG: HEAT repeat domain-containing protein [Thermoanaerobaculia bacterium]